MNEPNNLVFVLGKPYQPSLMFVTRAAVYLGEAPFRCSTLGWSPGLTHKHLTRQEKPARDKDSSPFGSFISYKELFWTLPGDCLFHIGVSFPLKDRLLALPVKKIVCQTETYQLISLKRQIMSKKFYNFEHRHERSRQLSITRCQFHKHFTCVTYVHSQIS